MRDAVEPGEAAGEPIAATASMRDAYAEALWSGRDALPVSDGGKIIGRVTLARAGQARGEAEMTVGNLIRARRAAAARSRSS